MSDELDRAAIGVDDETPNPADGDLIEELSYITARLGYAERSGQTVVPPQEAYSADATDIEQWAQLAALLAQEATCASSGRQVALLLHELGRLHEFQLGQPERALELYRESHERYTALSVNTRALLRLLLKAGEHAEAVRVLSTELSSASNAAERVAIRLDSALVRMVHLGDLDRARDDLQKALEIDPDDGAVMQALVEVHERSRDSGQVEVLLRRQLRRTEDPRLRALLLAQIAQLREVQFGDTEGAAKLYRTALNAEPANRHVQRALLRTARAGLDHATAAKLCESLAESEQGSSAATLLWQAARIYSEELRNGDLALRALERAIELAPQDRGILTDLALAYERRKKWQDLVRTLERMADLSTDAAHSANLRHRAARVRMERLQDVDGAMSSLGEAFRLDPQHQGVRALLGRLYVRHERFEDLLQLLAAELEWFDDPERRATTAYRMGDIYERKLQDPRSAAEAYERALDLRPAHRPAIAALGRLYETLQQHEDLVATFERQVGVNADREEKLVLLRQISETWERKLSDPAAALSAYERMIAIDPTNLTALCALRRIYSLGSRWQDLVGILYSEAEYTTDKWRKAALLSDAAHVYERRLERQEAALASCLGALEHVPGYQPALITAGRLLARAGDYDRLLELHRHELDATTDPTHRNWLLIKMGRLLNDRLGQTDEAVEVWLEAATVAPHSPIAADLVRRVARARGDSALQLKVLEQDEMPDSQRDLSLHRRRLAKIFAAEGREQDAIAQLRSALLGPEDPALHELAAMLERLGDRRGLVKLLESALQQADGTNAKLLLLHWLARLFSGMPHDLHRAAEAWERVLELSPRDAVALRQLEMICGQLGRWNELTAVVELQREHSEDEDFRLGCALEIAALREDRLDDLPGAAQAAVEVLERRPTHSEALTILEHHARWSRNSDELLQVLGRWLKMAQTAAEQAALLVATAGVHANCDRMERACEFFRLAIDVMPTYLPALRGWSRAAAALGDTAQLARALELEARASKTPDRQVICWEQAARLWELRNDDPERAVKGYWRVLQIQPRHDEATRGLGALLGERQDYRQLVRLLEHQVLHADGIEQQRDLLVRMADVQRSRLEQVDAARKTISRALDLFPQDRQLLSTLAEICRSSEDYDTLVEVNQRLVEATDDPALVKALHFEIGKLWEERLADSAKSIAAYREVLRLDPQDLGALSHLSTLLRQLGDWAGAAEALEKLAQRDNDRARIKGYYLTLAQIYADGFSELDRAVEVCRKALFLDPGDARATDVMAELLERKGDLRGLNGHLESTLAVHRARLDRDPFAVDSYQALLNVFERQNAVGRVGLIHCSLAIIGAASGESRSVADRLRSEGETQRQRALTREEIEGALVHPDERGALRQVLLAAEPVLRKVAQPTPRVPRKASKLSARGNKVLAEIVKRVSDTVGASGFNSYVLAGAATGVFARDSSTPSLIFAGEVAQLPPDELHFLVARQIARITLGHTLVVRLGAEEMGKTMAALLWIVCATFNPPYAREDLAELRLGLEKALSGRLRARLEAPAVALSARPFDPQQWFGWLLQSEDRMALVVSGDLQAALKVLLREEAGAEIEGISPGRFAEQAGPRTRHLLSFAVSEEYLTLRERLGLALK